MNKIKAPKNKVLKAYLIDIMGEIRHCLINEWGLVFSPGYGWSDIQKYDYKIIPLPNPVDSINWNMKDWWEKHWHCDSWAWCYMDHSNEIFYCRQEMRPKVFINC